MTVPTEPCAGNRYAEPEQGIDQQKLIDLSNKILANKQRSDIKNLVATKLAMAFYAPTSLQNIRHTLEAILVVPEPELLSLGFTMHEITQANRYRDVANSLINFQKVEHGGLISFSFHSDEAYLYLGFYRKWTRLPFRSFDEAYRTNNRPWYLKMLAEYLQSESAPLGLCMAVIVSFSTEATVFCERLKAKLFNNYITGKMWEEALGRVKGGDGGDE